jgi:nucleotide-binding universal stress UspA family protein
LKEILSSLNDLVTSPESIVLLHVEQLEGNAMMTAMLSESEMSTLGETLKGTEHKEALDGKAEKILAHYTKELQTPGFTNLKSIIREGYPLEEILKVSGEEGVDLIIVGCSSKSRLQRMVTGCVSKDLERTATVPVLIAKGDVWPARAYLEREGSVCHMSI